jgi:N-methylhydantoinase A/acetophenone carboxylase
MGGINVECFYLTAFVETPLPEIRKFELKGAEPLQMAIKEPRRAFWDALGGFKETAVFAYEALEPGNQITGPALIEARDTTFVIEPGWKFTLDLYFNGALERI